MSFCFVSFLHGVYCLQLECMFLLFSVPPASILMTTNSGFARCAVTVVLTRPRLRVPCLHYRLQRLMIVYFSCKLKTYLRLTPSRRAHYIVSFQPFYLHSQAIRLLLMQPPKISAGSLLGKTHAVKLKYIKCPVLTSGSVANLVAAVQSGWLTQLWILILRNSVHFVNHWGVSVIGTLH